MTFLRPDLLAFAPIGVLVVFVAILAQWRRGRRLVEAYGGFVATDRLTNVGLGRFPTARVVSLVLAMIVLPVLAAGPQREATEEVERTTRIDLVVVVDVSLSMTATDVATSRIERARETVHAIAEALPADRIALSLFADWPYGLVPLTDDADVVDFFTPWVVPDLLGERDQGTSMAAALSHAQQTLVSRDEQESDRIVLLISDGEAHEGAPAVLDSINALVDRGTSVWVAGVGSAGGAPLFALDADGVRREGIPLLDTSGQPIVAQYDEALLRDLSDVGGGAFHDVSTAGGIRGLIRDLRNATGIREASNDTGGPDASWLLVLVLGLLGWDLLVDSGRGIRVIRLRRSGDA